ncbi:MAG TPA: hypothetical protein DCS82_12705 [Rhodospirillaceae bacterium]|nr:hypothetical protein [Rhodospirillaceae bacterium]HAA92199.1 hypothetical protein [Rhodospirillaceae bacterium]HAT36566.1 hypothetical protein [Rhodospirillaceae bacterium]|tara:strand:- start:59 stop:391 length:333 start_codon:yes stop_codon:yes gene_type:complete
MADEADILNADIEMADGFIHLANEKLEQGVHPLAISAAMIHAAANFTAFAYSHGSEGPLDEKRVIEEFHQLLQGYDDHHRQRIEAMKEQQDQSDNKSSIERLVDQVKDEQ